MCCLLDFANGDHDGVANQNANISATIAIGAPSKLLKVNFAPRRIGPIT